MRYVHDDINKSIFSQSQVGIVSYMESMMLGDPFNFLSNWPKYIWLKHVPTCSLVS